MYYRSINLCQVPRDIIIRLISVCSSGLGKLLDDGASQAEGGPTGHQASA